MRAERGADRNGMSTIVTGELKRRLEANAFRLQDEMYCYPKVFQRESYDWAGDWEGRAILALCGIYKAGIGAYSEHALGQVHAIVAHLDEYTNEDGYFGRKFDGNTVNEQQLSGNSWFLRGLCAYYRITGEAAVLARIKRICDTFLIRIGKYFDEYPLSEREEGGVGGHLEKRSIGHWLLSSDVGCAFILLDGITAAYELYPNDLLRGTIEKMLDNFLGLDFVKVHCQTHATLSGVRGMLRFADSVGNTALYAQAEKIFAIYQQCGMTLNYANYNWFGKPYWTEPCGVVDSLIVAQKLFVHTKKAFYLQLISRIYRNAIRSGQRANGGAGCDTCLTETCNAMKVHLYEAYFCCSMRLAEGLETLKAFSVCADADGLLITGEPCRYTGEGVSLEVLREESGAGELVLRLNAQRPRRVQIYFPKGTTVSCPFPFFREDLFVTFAAGSGTYRIAYKYGTYTEERFGHTVRFFGDDLLSRKNDDTDYTPIQDASVLTEKQQQELVQYFW